MFLHYSCVAPVPQKPAGSSIIKSSDDLATLADNIARLCRETSNLILQETAQLSNSTAADIKAVSARNVPTMDNETRIAMEDLSNQAFQDMKDFSAQTIASSNQHSNAIRISVQNIPSDTVALQNDVLKDLSEQLAKDVAEAVKQTLAAVLTPSPQQN